MSNPNNYENLYFNTSTNVILQEHFPEAYSCHWHKCIELMAMPLDARVTTYPVIRINNQEYEMHPGDVLFMWTGELHEIRKNVDKKLIGMQFSATLFHELADLSAFVHNFRSYHLISHDEMPMLAETLMEHISYIEKLRRAHSPFFSTESLITLLQSFLEFARYIREHQENGDDATSDLKSSTMEKINQACNYIIENCDQELTLEKAAEYISFSPCYFSRVFKQGTGYSYVEYLTLQRVKRAQQLLSDTNAPITEILYQAGFKSFSSFNRAFRQHRGCSPSEYRKYYLVH